MSINHLTDDQIQQFLDGSADISACHHLENCSICREHLKVYEGLYNELKRDTPVELSADFPRKIMDILNSGSGQSAISWITVVLSLLGVAGAFLTIFFYYGVGFIRGPYEQIVVSFEKAAEALNNGFILVVATVLILIFLGILDRNIARVRRRIL
ncbi:hypothetical protein TRIP_C20774 [Candidatus Zixiibacteriota bacterium]|nr:hypothetical protein TRIP_C20774 [candidate division Zixibacteria bacterium]